MGRDTHLALHFMRARGKTFKEHNEIVHGKLVVKVLAQLSFQHLLGNQRPGSQSALNKGGESRAEALHVA